MNSRVSFLVYMLCFLCFSADFCARITEACHLIWRAFVGYVSVDGWMDSLMDRQLGFKVGDAYVLCFQLACLPQCTCLCAVYRTIHLLLRYWNFSLWLMRDLLYSDVISFLTLINFSLTCRWSIMFSWNRGNLKKQPSIASIERLSNQPIVASGFRMVGQNFSDQYIFSNMWIFLTVWHVSHGADFTKYLPYSSFMSRV